MSLAWQEQAGAVIATTQKKMFMSILSLDMNASLKTRQFITCILMHINIIQQYSEVYTGPVKFNNYSLTVVRMSLALMQSSNPNCSNWILFA